MSLICLSFTALTQKTYAYEGVEGNAKILGYTYNFVKSEYFSKPEVKAEVAVLDRDFLSNIHHMKGEISTGDSYDVSGTSVEEFRKKLSVEINSKTDIGGTYELFSASMANNFGSLINNEISLYASSFFKQYSSLQIKERYFLPDFKSNKNIYNSNLDKTFENTIISMNNKAQNQKLNNSDIYEFFDLYGTHILHDVLYGGKIDIFQSLHSNKEVYDSSLASDISSQISASYGNILTGNISSSTKLNKNITEIYKSEKTITKITTQGGTSVNFTSTDQLASSVNKWYDSINDGNYYPVSINKNGAMAMWDFLPDKYTALKNSLKAKFSEYAKDNLLYNNHKSNLPELILDFQDLGEVEIKSGRFKNNSTIFDLSSKIAPLEKLKKIGYKNVEVQMQLDIKEKNDGYQSVLFYSNNTPSDDYIITSVEFEHGGKKKDTKYSVHKYTFNVDIDKLTDENKIVLRYGARGFLGDRWFRKNLKLKVIIS